MTPDEKRGLLELVCWIVDELERRVPDIAMRADTEGKASDERIANMRTRLGELGAYAKKPYTAPELQKLDAAEVVERLLVTLSEQEIQMVLGRVAVRRQVREAMANTQRLVSCTCSSERDLGNHGHERGCPQYGKRHNI